MLKNVVRVTAALLCLLMLSGCWNRRELSELGVVLGVGLDMGRTPDEIRMTIQVENTAVPAGGEGGGGGGDEKAYVNLENYGTEVFSIIRDYNSTMTRKLYFPHNLVIVVGEDVAKAGLTPYLDFFLRDPECRMIVRLLVVRGTAYDALMQEPYLEQAPAKDFAQLVENQARTTSEVPDVNLFDYFVARVSTGTVPVVPVVSIEKTDEGTTGVVAGSAVFADGRMIGQLNGVQTRGMQWITGKVRSCIVNVNGADGAVAIEITKVKSKIKPVVGEDGVPKVKVEIDVTGNLAAQQGMVNQAQPTTMNYLTEELTDYVHAEAMLALHLAQEMRADIFGFGLKFSRYYPKEWDTFTNNWSTLFSKLDVEITVNSKLEGTGKLTQPAQFFNEYLS